MVEKMRISSLFTKSHKLKLLETFADDVLIGYKTFEVRKNDRGFQKGDTVKFVCVDSNGVEIPHSINTKTYRITYVLNGWGIENGYVVFGIQEVKEDEID
jgi:hypothetical protein